MIQSPLELLRRLPRAVRILIWGTLVNKLGTFILPYLSLVLVREFRLTPEGASVLLASYGAGSLASILLGGVLTDSLGRRRTMLLSLLGSGALAVAMGFAPSMRVFVPLLLAFAFLADLYRPASSAMIGDLLPSSERAVGFAALRVAVNLGFAVGMGLGGLLVGWNWRAMFVADGLTTLACGAIVYFLVAESRPEPSFEEAAAGAPVATGWRLSDASLSPWRDRTFLELACCSLILALVIFSDFTVFPLTVTLGAGYAPAVFGLLTGANGLLITLFEVSATAYLKRWRRLRVAAVGMLFSGVGFGMIGLWMHWSWFLLSVVLWTIGEILVMPQMAAFVADWAPPPARGRYMALYSATWSLAVVISPMLFLPLHARLGERAFWPLLLLAVLPAAALLWRLDGVADRAHRLRGRTREAAGA